SRRRLAARDFLMKIKGFPSNSQGLPRIVADMTHPTDNLRLTHSTAKQVTRKRMVRFGLGLAVAGAILASTLAPGVLAQTQTTSVAAVQTVSPTITTGDIQPLTVAETEGPYFKTNSPERTSLVDASVQGTELTITGQVLTQDGTPVANALLDFWQANASGAYDNAGYDMRGHQYTDTNGYYTLTTVIPGLYPGRTRHIHVKVQAPNGPVLTTQLFFPGEA